MAQHAAKFGKSRQLHKFLAPDGWLIVEGGRLARQPSQPGFEGFGEQGFDRFQQSRKIEGLFQQGSCASADCGKKLVGPRCNDDDGHERMIVGEPLESVPAVLDRQIQIEQNDVNVTLAGEPQGFQAILRGDDLVIFAFEDTPNELTNGGFVVDQQNGFRPGRAFLNFMTG